MRPRYPATPRRTATGRLPTPSQHCRVRRAASRRCRRPPHAGALAHPPACSHPMRRTPDCARSPAPRPRARSLRRSAC
ncbi:hypothetical protein DBA20_14275 [Pandoraea capi]|nr:hypothetical protein [Pandoraea sp. LA3]MDN4584152.1 hypothetical protein [Pandoraea capi]